MSSQPEALTSKASLTISLPSLLIKAESLCVFIAAIAFYIHQHSNGWLFLALILAPDLSMIGYMGGVKLGSLTYNTVHTYITPILLLALSMIAGWLLLTDIAVIWIAHIAMDRTVGYGLKYATNFKDTHLNRI